MIILALRRDRRRVECLPDLIPQLAHALASRHLTSPRRRDVDAVQCDRALVQDKLELDDCVRTNLDHGGSVRGEPDPFSDDAVRSLAGHVECESAFTITERARYPLLTQKDGYDRRIDRPARRLGF